MAQCSIFEVNIVYKSVVRARSLLKTKPPTPSGLAEHLKKNEKDSYNAASLLIENSPQDDAG